MLQTASSMFPKGVQYGGSVWRESPKDSLQEVKSAREKKRQTFPIPQSGARLPLVKVCVEELPYPNMTPHHCEGPL